MSTPAASLSRPLHEGCAQHLEALLTDTSGRLPLAVILDAVRLDGLHLRIKGLRSDLVLPALDEAVQVQFRMDTGAWSLGGRVLRVKPLVIRPEGDIQQLDSRAAARVRPHGVGVTWVDSGKGPLAADLRDLSLGGCALIFQSGPEFPVGQLVSIRVAGTGGDLSCLGTVRFRLHEEDGVRIGVQFGILTEVATRLITRWTTARR
ncbi:MAG: PilZ domain-containing protein [Myxococcales bacterium]|nr:PilZ domain-containing protein [Myxococcales bacterium]